MLSSEDKQKVEVALNNMGPRLNSDKAKDYSLEDLSVIYSVAYTLYQAGDYKEAIIVFQRLVSHDPLTVKNWMGLAASLQMEKDYEESLKAWAMASIISPNDPLPHYHAAECYLELGNEVEGKKAMSETRSLIKKEEQFYLFNKLESLECCFKEAHQKGA